MSEASAPLRLVMSAWKSLRPSSISTTASPSISALPHRQTANRLGDRREPIGEVRAASAPDLRALAQLADKNSETVMLDFVQPTGSGGRAINERGFAWADEADRRESSPKGRRGPPRLAGRNHQADAVSLAANWAPSSRSVAAAPIRA